MSPVAHDALLEVVRPLCDRAGVDLEDLQVTSAGRRRQLRLLVDKDGGVGLEECAELSRAVSDALDARDLMGPAPYTLEVSSPGVARPLTLPRHWRRNAGRLVRVSLAGGAELTGRVEAADDESVTLAVDGAVRRLPYSQLAAGRVQVEFRRPEDPGDDPGDDTGATGGGEG